MRVHDSRQDSGYGHDREDDDERCDPDGGNAGMKPQLIDAGLERFEQGIVVFVHRPIEAASARFCTTFCATICGYIRMIYIPLFSPS